MQCYWLSNDEFNAGTHYTTHYDDMIMDFKHILEHKLLTQS